MLYSVHARDSVFTGLYGMQFQGLVLDDRGQQTNEGIMRLVMRIALAITFLLSYGASALNESSNNTVSDGIDALARSTENGNTSSILIQIGEQTTLPSPSAPSSSIDIHEKYSLHEDNLIVVTTTADPVTISDRIDGDVEKSDAEASGETSDRSSRSAEEGTKVDGSGEDVILQNSTIELLPSGEDVQKKSADCCPDQLETSGDANMPENTETADVEASGDIVFTEGSGEAYPEEIMDRVLEGSGDFSGDSSTSLDFEVSATTTAAQKSIERSQEVEAHGFMIGDHIAKSSKKKGGSRQRRPTTGYGNQEQNFFAGQGHLVESTTTNPKITASENNGTDSHSTSHPGNPAFETSNHTPTDDSSSEEAELDYVNRQDAINAGLQTATTSTKEPVDAASDEDNVSQLFETKIGSTTATEAAANASEDPLPPSNDAAEPIREQIQASLPKYDGYNVYEQSSSTLGPADARTAGYFAFLFRTTDHSTPEPIETTTEEQEVASATIAPPKTQIMKNNEHAATAASTKPLVVHYALNLTESQKVFGIAREVVVETTSREKVDVDVTEGPFIENRNVFIKKLFHELSTQIAAEGGLKTDRNVHFVDSSPDSHTTMLAVVASNDTVLTTTVAPVVIPDEDLSLEEDVVAKDKGRVKEGPPESALTTKAFEMEDAIGQDIVVGAPEGETPQIVSEEEHLALDERHAEALHDSVSESPMASSAPSHSGVPIQKNEMKDDSLNSTASSSSVEIIGVAAEGEKPLMVTEAKIETTVATFEVIEVDGPASSEYSAERVAESSQQSLEASRLSSETPALTEEDMMIATALNETLTSVEEVDFSNTTSSTERPELTTSASSKAPLTARSEKTDSMTSSSTESPTTSQAMAVPLPTDQPLEMIAVRLPTDPPGTVTEDWRLWPAYDSIKPFTQRPGTYMSLLNAAPTAVFSSIGSVIAMALLLL